MIVVLNSNFKIVKAITTVMFIFRFVIGTILSDERKAFTVPKYILLTIIITKIYIKKLVLKMLLLRTTESQFCQSKISFLVIVYL